MKEQVTAYLQTIAREHLPSNARHYSWASWFGAPVHNSLGGISFLTPKEGKVIAQNEQFSVLKTARTEFCVVLNSLLKEPLVVGSTVKLSFYQLRDFEGLMSDGSEDPAEDGVRTMMLTGATTYLPVNWEERHACRRAAIKAKWQHIQNPYLRDVVLQLEQIKVGAGRSLVDLLVSAKAKLTKVVDPDEGNSWNEDIELRPGLHFEVNCPKLAGTFAIIYDRSMDVYTLINQNNGSNGNHSQRASMNLVHVDDLAGCFAYTLGDDDWQKVDVQVIKAAPKTKAAKAVKTASLV